MLQVIISTYRWILGYAVFFLGAPLLIIVTFLPPERLRYRAATWFSRSVLFALGARLKMEGRIPTDRAYIFMANHASFADVSILAAVMRRSFTGIMATESFRYPLWGALARRFRVISIRRQDRASAIASMGIAERLLQDGLSVVMLPEGTRTITGRMGPLKKGGFHMALNTGAPIQVIGIEGAYRFKRKTSVLLRPGPITVRFGKLIPPERHKNMSLEEVMEEVREELLVLSGEVAGH